jgi:iron complex transport system permease protein
LSLGSVQIPFEDVLKILFDSADIKQSWTLIVLKLRLPRAITAIAVGMALSLSGLQMQTFFHNPLAGPFVLGISSGASLGVAFWVLAGISIGFLADWELVLAATLGAGVLMSVVMLASLRIKNSMALLIVGLMFGSATGAIVGILQFFSQADKIQLFLIWTFGSLAGVTWTQMPIFLPLIILGILGVFFIQKNLDALLLGEEYAASMGVNIKKLRFIIIITTSLLAGVVTAFCGPIGFIGIAVPHLSRVILNTASHRLLIPASCLIGANLMLICDIISQLPSSDKILPINAVTALLGAPIVIWVILRKQKIFI